MKALVTGGNGFIGRRLVSALLKRGTDVNILDLPSSPTVVQEAGRVRIFSGNILRSDEVERAMEGCDHVYHLAGYARNWAPDEQTFFDVNVHGTKTVLEAARRNNVQKVVHTSSNVALGPSCGDVVDEMTTRRTEFFTPYEKSKFISEQLAQRYVADGLRVVIVNPTRVFGPGPLNESNSVTKMIDLYLRGKWRVLLGDGTMVGNYAFIDDLVDGYLRAMEYGRSGQNYILGGENVSFNEFFDLLSRVAERRYAMMHLPACIALTFSRFEEYRSTITRHYPLITAGWARTFLTDWANSCEKARRELGYVVTPLREAMKKTLDWLRDQADHENAIA